MRTKASRILQVKALEMSVRPAYEKTQYILEKVDLN